MTFLVQPQSTDPLGFVFAWPIAGVTDRSLLHAAALSAFSVHHFHPESLKIFLVPEFEASSAEDQLPLWARDFVTFQRVSPPNRFLDNDFRSRWIKTHAFGILRRNTILLDADTLMVAAADPADLARVNAVGAARDRVAVDFEEISYRNAAQELFAGAGWEWPDFCNRSYFNTGVIVYRHGAESEDYARAWESTWLEFIEKTGFHFDQAAFNRVASQRRSISELPVAYNAPVAILPSLAGNAYVYHYYSSGTRLENLRSHLMGAMLKRSLEDPNFSPIEIRRHLVNGRHPYVSAGMPSRAYRDSGQKVLFLRAKISELPADVAQFRQAIFRMLRIRFRHSVKALPVPIRRLGRFVRDRLEW